MREPKCALIVRSDGDASDGSRGAPTKLAVVMADEIAIAHANIQDNLDPHQLSTGVPDMTFMGQMFDSLTGRDKEGKLEPALAASWTSVNPQTWEFKLRPGVKFHNGALLTSADVAASINRFADPGTQNPFASHMSLLDKVDAVDASTVRVTTKQPDALFLGRLLQVRIVSAQALAQGTTEFVQRPIGTGPYRLKDRVPGTVMMEAFDESWRGAPPVKQARVVRITEPSTMVSALRTGGVDIAIDLPADLEASLRADANLELVLMRRPSNQHVNLNLLNFQVVQDRRVRHALNHAVDKAAVDKAATGGYGIVSDGQLVNPGITGYNPRLSAYPYDPARARALMAEAGMAAGFATPFVTPTGTLAAAAEAVAGYLNQVGVRTTLEKVEFGVFNTRFREGSMPALWYSSIDYGPLMDADLALNWFSGAQPQALRRMDNPDFTRLLTASKVELDPARREMLLQEAAAILREEAPVIFMYGPGVIYGFSKKVTGVQQRADNHIRLEQVSKHR